MTNLDASRERKHGRGELGLSGSGEKQPEHEPEKLHITTIQLYCVRRECVDALARHGADQPR